MKKVFIHIGQHKTGTTQIQRALGRCYYQNILEKYGYFYPKISPHSDHDYLHEYLKKRENASLKVVEMVSNLLRFISTNDGVFIISAEGLQEIEPVAIKSLFSEFDTTIVCYIREQADYLSSAYQQEVKSGNEFRTYEGWLNQCFDNIGVYYLDRWIQSWESAFGRDQVIVRRFCKRRLIDGDVLKDFLTVIGLENAKNELVEDKDNNKKISNANHFAMQIINRFGFKAHHVLQATYGINKYLAQFSNNSLGVDPFVLQFIRNKSAIENKQLGQNRFGEDALFDLKAFSPYKHPSFFIVFSYLTIISFVALVRKPRVGAKIFLRFLFDALTFRLFYIYKLIKHEVLLENLNFRSLAYNDLRKESSMLESIIIEKDVYVKHLEASFESERYEVNRLVDIVNERDKFIKHLNAELESERNEVKRLVAIINERDCFIAHLNSFIKS